MRLISPSLEQSVQKNCKITKSLNTVCLVERCHNVQKILHTVLPIPVERDGGIGHAC